MMGRPDLRPQPMEVKTRKEQLTFYGKFIRNLRTKLGIYLDLGRGKLMDAEYF